MRRVGLGLGLACMLACRGFAYHRPDAAEARVAHAAVRRASVDTGGWRGLSDLTVDGQGHFWSPPERGGVLLRLHLGDGRAAIDAPPLRLVGVEPDLDVEALAWLSANKFALGTERNAPGRTHDDILFVTVHGNVAQVTHTVPLPYALWGMTAQRNRGIEGLCAAGGRLVAAVETTGQTHDGHRFAPLGRYDARRGAWEPFRLLLTTDAGKISALTCRQDASSQAILALAIERHFKVSRVLRFTLPTAGEGVDIVPEVLVDIARLIDDPPNFEGIAWSQQGDVVLLSDNDYGPFDQGPTEAMFLPHTWLP